MRSHIKYQAGGTVMGLIIGLIIGLLVAVWVAMTIMKTPLPFVDKLGRHEQPVGDLGDPNKNLAGSGRERREKAAEESPPADAAGAPGMPEPAMKKTPVAIEADPLNSGAPPAVIERSRPEKLATETATVSLPAAPLPAVPPPTAEGTAPAGEQKFTYYLQAGAFREQTDAENTKGRLAMMGLAASIVERRSELGTLYRVRIGPFTEAEAMNRARTRLSDNGVDAAVVRMPK